MSFSNGRLLLVVIMLVGLFAAPPAASARTLEQKYTDLRVAAKKRCGDCVGRNIRRQGVRTPAGRVIEAKSHHFARSIRTFRRWLAPPAPAAKAGDAARFSPAFSGGAFSIPRPIVMCESGGNYRAVNNTPAGQANGTPAGAYQITGPTWIANGGGKYAQTADAATPAQQDEIAARIWNGGAGRGNWAC